MKDKNYLSLYINSGRNLETVPFESRTPELCLAAVKASGKNLKHVPNEFKNAELYMAAVKSNGKNLKYIPEKYKNAELCLNAVIKVCSNNYWEFDEIVNYIPKQFKNFKSGKRVKD